MHLSFYVKFLLIWVNLAACVVLKKPKTTSSYSYDDEDEDHATSTYSHDGDEDYPTSTSGHHPKTTSMEDEGEGPSTSTRRRHTRTGTRSRKTRTGTRSRKTRTVTAPTPTETITIWDVTTVNEYQPTGNLTGLITLTPAQTTATGSSSSDPTGTSESDPTGTSESDPTGSSKPDPDNASVETVIVTMTSHARRNEQETPSPSIIQTMINITMSIPTLPATNEWGQTALKTWYSNGTYWRSFGPKTINPKTATFSKSKSASNSITKSSGSKTASSSKSKSASKSSASKSTKSYKSKTWTWSPKASTRSSIATDEAFQLTSDPLPWTKTQEAVEVTGNA